MATTTDLTRCGYTEGTLRVRCSCGAIFWGARDATRCLACASRVIDMTALGTDQVTYEHLADRIADLSDLVTEIARNRPGGLLSSGTVMRARRLMGLPVVTADDLPCARREGAA